MQKSDLKKKELEDNSQREKAYCVYCFGWKVVTTNGKCFVCGAYLNSKYYNYNIFETMKTIWENHRDGISIPIKNKLYIVPYSFFDELANIHTGKQKKVFIEKIKSQCRGIIING